LKDKLLSDENQSEEHKYIVIEKLAHAYQELKERIKLKQDEAGNKYSLEVNRLSTIVHSAHSAGQISFFYRRESFEDWQKSQDEINAILRGLSAPIYEWFQRQMSKITLESNKQKEIINHQFREFFCSKKIIPLS